MLEEQGWRVWWDADIDAGVQFDTQIEKAIKIARCVVVLWSECSINSQWVRSEAHEGFDRDILVPVMLDEVQLPLPFRLLQACDFHDLSLDENTDFTGLFEAIRLKISGEHSNLEDTIFTIQKSAKRPIITGAGSILLVMLLALLFYVVKSQIFDLDPDAGPAVADETVSILPPGNSIAVLPFLNMSGDASNDYFSDGIAEEILNSLASIGNFKVTARSSSFSFRGQQLDILTIGKRLNVGHLLEGSVRKQGDIVRISVQLVSATDGSQVWASTYDRQLDDIFAVQEDISRNIVGSLQIAITGNESALLENRPSADFAAFDMYLLGRHYLHQRTVESIEKSIDLFNRSIVIEPEFVLAYTGLADAYNLLTAYGSLSGQEAAALMRPVVETAMELDDSLAEVHTSYGAMFGNQGLLDQEAAAYRQAISLNNNYALAFVWLGNNLMVTGQLEEGMYVFQQALDLDPMNPVVILNLARSKMYLGKVDEAIRYTMDAENLVPGSALVYEQKSRMLREIGRLDESLLAGKKAAELDPEGAQVLAGVAASEIALGNLNAAKPWIERASEHAPNNWHVIWTNFEYYFLRGELQVISEFVNKRLSYALKDKNHSGPDLKTVYFWAGLAKLQIKNYEQAATYLDAAFSPKIKHQFEAQHELRFRGYRILAHRLADEIETADELLLEALNYITTLESQGWNVPEFKLHAASIHVIAGDKEKAYKYLQEAVDEGFRYFLTFENDPVLQSLHGEQLFEDLRTVIQRDLSRMQHINDAQRVEHKVPSF